MKLMDPKLEQNIKDIEKEFFECDDEKKIITMKLHFDSPKSIISENALTKIPMLTDDFIDWIKSSLEYAPKKYKIDLDVTFDEMDGYNEEQLKEIFLKNIILEGKKKVRNISVKNKIALGLLVSGLALLVIMILINTFWNTESVGKQICSYIFDILTTVLLWEALAIFIVENIEDVDTYKNLIMKYASISFKQKEK